MGSVTSSLPYLFGGTAALDQQMHSDLFLYFPNQWTPTLQVSAIIINISQSTSFDLMFTRYHQKSPDNTCTLVYHATYQNVIEIFDCLAGKSTTKKPILRRIVEQIKSIDPDCTIWNWECCSAGETEMFPDDGSTQRVVKGLLRLGYMVMFSDWSLKWLIRNWDEGVLGANPFIHVGDFPGGTVKLGFDKQRLLASPSTQLHLLAGLSETNFCEVKAKQKTIVYTLNEQKIHTQSEYSFDLLTVALVDLPDSTLRCGIGEFQGAAGHVLLKYKEAGHMLVSMSHWSELVNIETGSEKLVAMAEERFDEQTSKAFKVRINELGANRDGWNLVGQEMMQSLTPGRSMMSKGKLD